jgi:hypothetical protein
MPSPNPTPDDLFVAELMPPSDGPTPADRHEHAAWCALEAPDDFDAEDPEPADFAGWLLAESGRLNRLGTLAGHLAGRCLAELYRDVMACQSGPGQAIDAGTYTDRALAMAREARR